MSSASIDGLAVDIGRIRAAIGTVARVAYEAAHVYPLSAPRFTRSPGVPRERPAGGPQRLYVHVPFCRYACTFCFYAKRVNSSQAQMRRYVDVLVRELDAFGEAEHLQQLYVGGGTPTVLPAALLDDLLAAAAARLRFDPAGCHTVECSPESVGPAHVEVLQRRGIGRASLGVQTLDEGLLQSINRRHDARQALAACSLLIGGGLSVNVDLIYGFAGQREADLRRDVAAFADLGVPSFTLYNLRLNERTPLTGAVEELRHLDLAVLMRWRRTAELALRELGYVQTRWHMFRRRDLPDPGHDRAPGTNAFGAGRELGIGASAYSHLGETIYRNHENVETYLRRVEQGESPVEDVFPFAAHDRRTLFVARTLGDGRELDLADYERTFGSPFEAHFGPVLERLGEAGLVRETAGRLALTEVGRLVYDLVTIAFYPDDARQWLVRRRARYGAARSASRAAARA